MQPRLDEADAEHGEHDGLDDRERELEDVERPVVDVEMAQQDQVPGAEVR